jgi:hypothetical protein
MSNEQPTLSPDFDLDAWIDGTCGITTLAVIFQRGDLIAVRERLQEELAVTKKVKSSDRGVADRAPESVEADLEQVDRDLYGSVLRVTLEDRTAQHRRELRKKIVEDEQLNEKDDLARYNEVTFLAELADSIIKAETADGKAIRFEPGKFGWERLEKIRERCGEAALFDLVDRYKEMTSNAPAVQAPFSPSSSPVRPGTMSPRSSGRRGGGASRRG